jgi:predicted phage terminase large subunit-like protein
MSVDTVLDLVARAFSNPVLDRPDWSTPGALARDLDPTTRQTGALDIVDAALVDVAEGRTDRLIISMPPQEGKSERTTHYGALWMLARDPNLRIGIVSFDGNIASGFSSKIRNDILTFDGTDGNVDLGLRLRRDSKAASRWVLDPPHRGGCYAIGIGGALTGRPVDVLFIDDPVKDYKAADSENQSEAAWAWWTSVGRPRLGPGAPVVLILTRWSELDLAGRLLAKQAQDEAAGELDFDRWTVINIPAQADHDPAKGQVDPLGRQPGEFMDSARQRTGSQWRATKVATPPRQWQALFQGRPAPESGDVWKRQWWRRYAAIPWTVDADGTHRMVCDDMVLSWDMTFKDKRGSDFVVGQVLARIGADVYVLDQVRRRMTFTETIKAFQHQVAKWPGAAAKLVEDKANGSAVIDTLRTKIPGIVPVEPHGSKYARASAVSHFIEAGNVLLPHADIDPGWGAEIIDEAAAFPNGSNDDQVDALSQGLDRLLLGGAGAAQWIEFMKRRAETIAAEKAAEEQAAAAEVVELAPLEAARQAAFRAHRKQPQR